MRREFGIETSFNILFCGSGFHRKGLDQTLHVLNNLTKRHVDTSLLVVGKGDIQKFQSLARKMGISNRILFLGHRIHVEKYYSVSDILVLPTLFDPFPNTCLEAMSNGLPVITTKHTGISEIIDDGKDSFIIPSADNILQITDIITNLYKNRPLLDEISNSARLKAEKYDWESVTNKYIDIYHKIADSQVLAGR
ncbi:MAG: glycosyltransferase family 4 protein [Planctomycetes bacterium]|nr:glycosyltransferase family 4 protein [Planctomycetota bacterium]